ncbi:MAG: YIP1 family protein [Gemmatimonadetes bacterium]|nr:YIP1 family protein [Gemmatimonadota bacterium]
MTDDAAAPAPTPPKVSLAEDFVDIFTSPREVFARRATSGFGAMLLIVTIVLGVMFFLNQGTFRDIMEAEMARGMAEAAKQNPGMTAEQMETGKKVGEFIAMFGGFVGIPIALFCVGLVTWLTGRLFSTPLSYTAATMVACYSYVPRILEAVATSVQGILLDTTGMRGRFELSLGVGRFLDPEMSPGLLGLAGRIDVFTLWTTVLLVIGLMVVAKLPREKAVPAGVVVWVLGGLPAIWTLAKSALFG